MYYKQYILHLLRVVSTVIVTANKIHVSYNCMLKEAMQYSCLLQRNVLEPLYVGLVAIKLVNIWNF